MFSPQFVGRINYKPLIPVGGFDKFDPHKILKRMRREIIKQLKTAIMQETYSFAAKKRLQEGMEVKIGPRSVTVIAKDPAFRPLLEGQKSGQMKWLTKAKRPIPIVLDNGKLIFRSATPKSMANGKWIHPGRQPRTVLARARKAARNALRKRIKKELRKYFQAEMAKALR